MPESTPGKECHSIQSEYLDRAAFRMEVAEMLERAGASRAVDDEKLTTITQMLLDCLRDLDIALDYPTRSAAGLIERVQNNVYPLVAEPVATPCPSSTSAKTTQATPEIGHVSEPSGLSVTQQLYGMSAPQRGCATESITRHAKESSNMQDKTTKPGPGSGRMSVTRELYSAQAVSGALPKTDKFPDIAREVYRSREVFLKKLQAQLAEQARSASPMVRDVRSRERERDLQCGKRQRRTRMSRYI